MKQRHPVRTLFRNFFLAVFLAVACVCAAELLACRIMDPALYEEVVTPARNLYHEARAQVKGISRQYAAWLSEQSGLREELAQAQRIRAEERRAERLRLTEERRLRKEEEKRRKAEEKRRKEEEKRRKEEEKARLQREAQLAGTPAIQEDLTRADPAVTELIVEEGQEFLTGGNLKMFYYNQGDRKWSETLYGTDPLDKYGCGPTAIAMLVSSLKGAAVSPAEAAEWAANAGYAAPQSGSYLSIVNGAAKQYGFACDAFTDWSAERLRAALSEGAVLVALMGPGHFTAHGHFILLHGVTEDGEILVADPNSRENSLTAWDADVILSELSPSRNDGAPLWLVTPPSRLRRAAAEREAPDGAQT